MPDNPKCMLLSAFTLAMAGLTKPFAMYLYAVVFAMLLLVWNNEKNSPPLLNSKNVFAFVLITIILFLLVVNAGLCFNGCLHSSEVVSFRQRIIQTPAEKVDVVRDLPVPVPYPFLEGLDMLQYHDDSGLTYGKIYLLGNMRDPFDPNFQNFKSYYAVAMLFKKQLLCRYYLS